MVQAVRVNTPRGPVLLASDSTHYFANILNMKPFVLTIDTSATIDSYHRILKLAGGIDRLMPGHDPKVRRLYPAHDVNGIELLALHEKPNPISAAESGADRQLLNERRTMKITKAGTHKSQPVPAQYFTGKVRLDPVFDTESPARAKGNYVTFDPGARTNWHTHPLGQTIIITHGAGRVQCWGGPVQSVTVGDVVWFPPGEKHWHGAAPKPP